MTRIETRRVKVEDYYLVAMAVCDHGRVLVLNNNCDTYLVCEQMAYGSDDNLDSEAYVNAEFKYGESFVPAFKLAMERMAEIALRNTSDGE